MMFIDDESLYIFFFFNETATTWISPYSPTLSLLDALPISAARRAPDLAGGALRQAAARDRAPAEFHSPLQGQGQQGDAGAEPRQGAGAHGADRKSTRLNSSH